MRKPAALNPRVTRRLILATLALSATPALAAETFFIGGNATWNSASNWAQVGTDLTLGTGDDVNVKPGTADAAVILGGQTANLNSAETVPEVSIQHPSNAQDTAVSPGLARLNIQPGAILTVSSATGIRLGRSLDVAPNQQAIGAVRAEIVQTGGEVYFPTGANGLRLSATGTSMSDPNTVVPDSLYRISGGIFRGGAAGAAPTIVSDIRLGATGNTWNTAELHIVGSGATEISCLDFQMGANASTSFTGTSLVHFSLDANGVTPITAYDEFQFRGSASGYGHNRILIDLIAEPPEANIDLIKADRLNTNGGTTGAANERFENYRDNPATTDIDESLVDLSFNDRTFTYRLAYLDGSDDGVIDARVSLVFISATPAVPEPGAVAGLMAGSLALLARRRRV